MKNLLKYFILISIILISTNFNILIGWADERQSDYSAEREGKENSWRYEEGELIVDNSIDYYNRSRTVTSSSAVGWGIDVSKHNGKIDWEKVKSTGIDFVIIRCGYGMNLSSQDDEYWEYNVSECERLDIPYGVYLYSYADSVSRASSEADHVLRLLKGHNPDYPVYYDLEESSLESIGNRTLLANMAKTFCNKVSSAGYETGIYANLNWWNNYLTNSVFDNSGWDKWVAQYNSYCGYEKDFRLWQYTSKGSVKGISTYVDLNYEYSDGKPKAKIINMKNGIATLSWDAVPGAEKYAIALKGKNGYETYTFNCTDTKYEIEGLQNGNTYQFLVQAYINGKWSKYTEEDLVTCYFIESPNVKVESTGDGSVTLSWNEVEGAERYAIAEYINGKYKTYTYDCRETRYTINNLANGYSHKFLVQSNVNGKWSLCSTKLLVSATPEGRIKPDVKSEIKGNIVELSWDAVPGAEKYAIALKGKNGYETYTFNCTDTKYEIEGLQNGNTYQFLVQAYINGKWSKYTEEDLIDVKFVDNMI